MFEFSRVGSEIFILLLKISKGKSVALDTAVPLIFENLDQQVNHLLSRGGFPGCLKHQKVMLFP